MSDYEMVSELVKRTGATYEEARYAYEACGKDMLSAAIMLERSQSAKKSSRSADSEEFKRKLKENSQRAARQAGSFFDKLCRNTLKITGSREYISVPLIAALIIAIVFIQLAVPVVLITLACGINYVFTGPDFCPDRVISFNVKSKSAGEYRAKPADYSYDPSEEDTPKEEENDKGLFN